jgi:hypothetical protein
MRKTPSDVRAEIRSKVEAGRMSPDDAEAWATANKQPAFEKRPDVSGLDPMALDRWTLPMSAAYFIWRDVDAVRDQWNEARKGWIKWIEEPRRFAPNANQRIRWRLREIGSASLKDVFAQVRKSGFSLQTAGPYLRFKHAVQLGKLIAVQFWQTGQGEEAEPIPKTEWIRRLHEIEQPGDPRPSLARAPQVNLPKSSKLRSVGPTFPVPNSQDSTSHATRWSSIEDEDDESNLFISYQDKDMFANSFVERYSRDDNKIFLNREHVINVEEELSHFDVTTLVCGLEQVIGWITNPTQDFCRSIGPVELHPPRYCGKTYVSYASGSNLTLDALV